YPRSSACLFDLVAIDMNRAYFQVLPFGQEEQLILLPYLAGFHRAVGDVADRFHGFGPLGKSEGRFTTCSFWKRERLRLGGFHVRYFLVFVQDRAFQRDWRRSHQYPLVESQ